MSLRQMRAVLAVAEHGGFTSAAAHQHVAQSSLSRTVSEVEARLGVPLFERTGRAVLLTPEGEEFTALARRLLDDVDGGLQHFAGYLAGNRGSVSLATLPSLAAVLLPPVARAFRAQAPSIRLHVEDSMSAEILTRLHAGTADLAVTVAPGARDDPHGRAEQELVVREIAVDAFCALVRPDHRLAGRAHATWADLAGEDFIAFGDTSSISEHVERALASAGVRLGPLTRARNVGAVAGLAAAGLGVSAAPALVLPMVAFAGLVAVPLHDPVVERSICVVHHRSRPLSRPAARFARAVHAAAREGSALPPGARWTPAQPADDSADQ
ncbi:LysR family transcriptional regulator [Kineococcus sp. SYSU DK002]|uniref:LysR family transcriptional regulator n=1 Tax=Kineococcus sp. SYSU DK002 TaxID=3383123 RepID=UPI003D7CED5C